MEKFELIETKKLDYDREAEYRYDLVNEILYVHAYGGRAEEKKHQSKKEFRDNRRVWRRLGRKKLAELEGRIENNRTVIRFSQDDPKELEKAQRHLAKNEERLAFLEEYMETH